VDDEHARAGVVLGDHVRGEARTLFGGRLRAQALPDRHDVVVDGLGQAHDHQVVPRLLQVSGEVGRRRVGVVAADRVQHVDAVGRQPLGGVGQRVGPVVGDQPALDQVLDVGQLHA
jgi:hypothetical protein